MNILDRIRWYTQGQDPQRELRADYDRRTHLLEAAREAEAIAAAWQRIADQIREEA